MIKPLIALTVAALSLVGCASTHSNAEEAKPVFTSKYQPGELNGETLYDLLIAELAGRQGQFDLALGNYMRQARLTGDIEVAKRAARIAQYSKNTDAILEAAELWSKAAPEDSEPYRLSAGILLHRGAFDKALEPVQKSLAGGTHQVINLVNGQLGKMSSEQVGQYRSMLENHLAENPSAGGWLSLGLMQRKLQQTELAMESFDKAQAVSADYLDAHIQKAELYRDKEQFQLAIDTLQPQLSKHQSNRQLQAMYIQLLFANGDTASAVEQVHQLLEQFNKDQQLRSYIALLLFDYEQYDESRNLLQAMLAEQPDNSEPHFFLGLAAERQEQPEQAIGHYLQVVDGERVMAARARALDLLTSSEQRTRAEQIIASAQEQFSKQSPQWRLLLADWLRERATPEQAQAILDEVLTEFPDHIDARYARAMILEASDLAGAERDMRHILQLQPENAMTLNALGYTLTIRSERYHEALQLISQALTLQPEDPATLDSMGWVLFKLGRNSEALGYLQRAYDLYPDPEVGSHLVQVLMASDKSEQAAKIVAELKDQHPDNQHTKDAVAALAKTTP